MGSGSVVEQAEATADLEAVYREDGARLWRALYAYSNDAELAFDAAAEAFAQALGRGRPSATCGAGSGGRRFGWQQATSRFLRR